MKKKILIKYLILSHGQVLKRCIFKNIFNENNGGKTAAQLVCSK